MKKLSIRDIATELNISTATISYILNGKAKEKRISDELAERVQKFVEEKNYKPNQLAKSLRTGKSKIICLMIEDIADSFFSSVAGHIEDIAYEKGYKIIYCSTKNNTAKTKELIHTFRHRNVDGYIIAPPEGVEKEILGLILDKIPVIQFDRYCEGVKSSYVGMDNFESTYKGVNHLLEQGFKNIAFITLDSSQIQMIERLAGYTKAIGESKGQTLIKKIPYAQRSEHIVIDQITELLQQNPDTDAIFFATNYLAISGLESLNKLGLKLAEDIGIVVFDDNDLFRVHQPTITAVTQPVHEMSVQIINILLQHMADEKTYIPKNVIIPASLTIRQSSVKPVMA